MDNRSDVRKHKEENYITLNNILKKKLMGSSNESKNYLNSNPNNFAERETNEISDWEDFSLDDNEPTADKINQLLNDADDELDTFNLKYRGIKLDDIGSVEENFEILVSDDEDKSILDQNLSNKCEDELCKDNLTLQINFDDNQNTISCIYGKLKQYSLLVIEQFWNVILAFYYIFAFILSLPFRLLRLLFLRIKKLLSFMKFILTPFKLLKKLFRKRFSLFKRKNTKIKENEECVSNSSKNNMSTMNSNNNASDESCERTQRASLCLYIFCTAIVIGSLFVHCWFNSDSKICSINSMLNTIQLRLSSIFKEIYILPGDDCMKAGRCCKGFMEATFRWLNCLITLPIRSILTTWPRQSMEKNIAVDNIDDIKVRVQNLIQELINAKDRTNKQEELLIKLRQKVDALEKVIIKKSKDIIKLEPQIKYLANEMQQIRQNITFSMNEMANIISIKDNSDEIIESMKVIARDSSNSIKSLISKVQSEIEVEQFRLLLRIESLESLFNDNQNKEADSIIQILNGIRVDLDLLKSNQNEIRFKINSLKNIPQKYKRISDNLKTGIKIRLNDKLNDHNKMSKRTEYFCNKQMKNFKEKLDKSKIEFTCFIEKMVDKEADEIKSRIQKEISETFYDETVKLSKSIAEEALSRNTKGQRPSRQTIQSSGFLADFLKIEPVPYTCQSENSEKLLNYSAFCVGNKTFNKTLNEDNECWSNDKIRQMVKSTIAKYSADKIGLADFALESMGGSVITSRSSPTYIGRFGFLSFLINPLGRKYNSLRAIIQPGNQPGDCWSFAGSVGHAVIQLSHKIIVNAVSLEHLPARLHPDGKISTAPKEFQIFSLLENSYEKSELIGTFEYTENGPAIQTFLVTKPTITRIVQLDVLSNLGNSDYTCIYRLRIHGVLYGSVESSKP